MSLRAHLNQAVTIEPRSGNSAYGPVFGAPTTEQWYLEPGRKRVVGSDGIELVSSLQAFAPADSAVSIGDRVTYSGRHYEVIECAPLLVRGNVRHYEVALRSIK